jgi:hypothetical protein
VRDVGERREARPGIGLAALPVRAVVAQGDESLDEPSVTVHGLARILGSHGVPGGMGVTCQATSDLPMIPVDRSVGSPQRGPLRSTGRSGCPSVVARGIALHLAHLRSGSGSPLSLTTPLPGPAALPPSGPRQTPSRCVGVAFWGVLDGERARPSSGWILGAGRLWACRSLPHPCGELRRRSRRTPAEPHPAGRQQRVWHGRRSRTATVE